MSLNNFFKELTALAATPHQVPTAMIQRGIADWLGDASFQRFAEKFPQEAKQLKAVAQRHGVLSSAGLIAIGTLIGSQLMKSAPAIAHSALADFLTSVGRNVRGDMPAVSAVDYQRLGTVIMQMHADAMQTFIDWQRTFTDEQRSLVYAVLSDKSAAEIEELLQLDEEKRWDILNFMYSCATHQPFHESAEEEAQSADESPLLGGLRSLREHLERKQSERRNSAQAETEESDGSTA